MPTDYFDSATVSCLVGLTADEGIDDGRPVPVTVTPAAEEYIQHELLPINATLSASDVLSAVDAGLIIASVGFSGVDCYNIATPNYEVTDFKKWEIEEGITRWGTTEIGKRWSLVEVVGAFDNECRGL